ncbi:Hypothetical_protein [Hexamita inflata]|uniref:Hypothetical_protein n=1 Tax=Hexamita inflata TaxID=28002 RepID=A0AA86NBC4_9EUKA|nr:Hypothetical protein HINF_LOCUS3830 [Hexamita inflata]
MDYSEAQAVSRQFGENEFKCEHVVCALNTRWNTSISAVQFIPPDLISKQICIKWRNIKSIAFHFSKIEKVKTCQRSYVYVQLIINMCVLVGHRYIAQRQFTLV